MSDRQEWNAEVSSLLKNIYRCVDKSSWYDTVAEAYDCTRPRYPAEILARMQEIAQIQPNKSVLEIGAGPGIASIELAELGANTICLEPSLSAYELGRSKCATYPNVEFVNTTFEDWALDDEVPPILRDRQFDVVVAATSFHWITPEVRNRQTAAVLKDGGLLILLWNTPPQPSYRVHQTLTEVYLTHAPELAKYEGHQNHRQNLSEIGNETIESGYFQDLVVREQINHITYAIDDYLTLLSTLSPYIRLDAPQRELLFAELRRVLQFNYGDKLELSYLSLLQVARKS